MALTKIGVYQVKSLLGEGPRGSVYLCRDRDDHRLAVRVFQSTRDPEGFLKSAGALKALGEHHLALIEDFGIQEGRPFLASELVKGEVLSTWLEDKRSLGDQLKLIEGLLSALHTAHDHGIVHGRVQPSNIHAMPDGECRLLDLGVSSIAEGATATPTPYVAPELLDGGVPSPKTDIYSTGVVCYEMLAGRLPFDPSAPSSGLQSLRTVRPDLPRDLSDAVMACLDKDPEWRPKDLGYLLQVVKQLREAGLPKGARAAAKPAARSSVAAPAARSARPRSADRSGPPMLPIALGVVALAGGAFWLWSRISAPPPVGSRQGVAASSAAPSSPAATEPAPVVSTPSSAGPVGKPTAAAAPTRVIAGPEPALATPAPTAAVAAAVLEATPVPARPTAAPLAAATPVPLAPTPAPTPAPTTPAPSLAPVTAPAEPEAPAVLTTVAPRILKKGSTGIVDIHGLGLRTEHQIRIWKGRDTAPGFSLVRQRRVSDTLIQAVLQVDPAVAAGPYVLVLVDSKGVASNLLPIEVAK